ncbi:MAG TPA: hypothetical protein VHM70_00445 [Polyangiaceae bacterium]|jgi:hypothetical protein|nr:hypothetical protein [Polyangiaceae bacterium]
MPWNKLLTGLVLPLLIGVAFTGYIVIGAKHAATKVTAFCESVEEGAPIAGLPERAKQEGLGVHDFPVRDGKGVLIFEDGVLLARHTCTIEHREGRVTHKEKSFMD